MLPVMFAQQPAAHRAAADGRRRAGRSSSTGRRRSAMSRPPSTGSSAGTWTSRPSSTGCSTEHGQQRAAGPGAWPGRGSRRCWRHLAWWWQRTGLVEQVFRFSYEDRAWTAAQIIREIRSRLLSPAEHARGRLDAGAGPAEQVAALLRATRHLLILDNAESVTAAPAAIPHALDPRRAGQAQDLAATAARRPDPGPARLPRTRNLAHRRQHRAGHLPAARPGPPGRLAAGRAHPGPPPRHPLPDRHQPNAAALEELVDTAGRLPAAADRRAAGPGHRRAVAGAGRTERRAGRARTRPG